MRGGCKIIAHLLNLKPTPQELLAWLSDEHELERRLKGTPLAAMIYENAGPQRGGMLATLSMVADSLSLLPVKTPSLTNIYRRRVGEAPARLGFCDQYSRSQGTAAGAHQHVAGHDDPAADEPGQTSIAPGVVCAG